jgi:hypothetical protein
MKMLCFLREKKSLGGGKRDVTMQATTPDKSDKQSGYCLLPLTVP